MFFIFQIKILFWHHLKKGRGALICGCRTGVFMAEDDDTLDLRSPFVAEDDVVAEDDDDDDGVAGVLKRVPREPEHITMSCVCVTRTCHAIPAIQATGAHDVLM